MCFCIENKTVVTLLQSRPFLIGYFNRVQVVVFSLIIDDFSCEAKELCSCFHIRPLIRHIILFCVHLCMTQMFTILFIMFCFTLQALKKGLQLWSLFTYVSRFISLCLRHSCIVMVNQYFSQWNPSKVCWKRSTMFTQIMS